MGDVPFPKPKEPTIEEELAQLAYERRLEQIEALRKSAHVLLTGDTGSPLRRPFLFIVAGAFACLGLAWAPLTAVSLIAIILLALTDRVPDAA